MNRNKKKISILLNQKWVLSSGKIEAYLMGIDKKNIKFYEDKLIFLPKFFFAVFVVVLSIVKLFYIYFSQYFIIHNKTKKITTVLLTVGRNYETVNMNKVKKINNKSSIIINSFIIYDFMKNIRISFFDLYKCFYYSCIDFFSVLKINLPSRIVFLIFKNVLLNISNYSYYRSFFIALRKKIVILKYTPTER